VKAGAENFILRTEGSAQNFLKYAKTPNPLHFKVLAFYPFCAHETAHDLTVVFGIRSGFTILYRSQGAWAPSTFKTSQFNPSPPKL